MEELASVAAVSASETMNDNKVTEAVGIAARVYGVLAEYLPGDTTLNELRVLTAVAEAACAGGPGTSVTKIADETGISRATVSRLIAQWTAAGQILEEVHPHDGRRRVLGFSEEAHRLNREWSAKMHAAMAGKTS